MLSFLKAKWNEGLAEYTKFNDRETAEAIVAIMCGTAYADGEMEMKEKNKFKDALSVNPILKQFDTSVLISKWDALSRQCEFDTDVGADACVKELTDVSKRGANEEKRIAILRMGVAAAKSDGEIEPTERAFLSRAATALGIATDQVGL
jgi:tellurite resistance protein TerB